MPCVILIVDYFWGHIWIWGMPHSITWHFQMITAVFWTRIHSLHTESTLQCLKMLNVGYLVCPGLTFGVYYCLQSGE